MQVVRNLGHYGQQWVSPAAEGIDLMPIIIKVTAVAVLIIVLYKSMSTRRVVTNVLAQISPYLITSSAWQLSHITNMKIFGVICSMGLTLLICLQGRHALYHHYHHNDRNKSYVILFHLSSGLVRTFDDFGAFPINKYYRVAIDSLTLLSAGLACVQIFDQGKYCVAATFHPRITWEDRITLFATGVISMGFGTYNAAVVITTAQKLLIGGWALKLNALDPMQEHAMVKYRAIHHFTSEAKCNAVVIDNSNPVFPQAPFIEKIYSECHTLVYRIDNSDKQFCQVLGNATKHQNHTIDLLTFFSKDIRDFPSLYSRKVPKNEQALNCIDQYLKKNAQILLFGPYGQEEDGNPPVASVLNKCFPKREVISFDGKCYSYLTAQSFKNGKFIIECFSFLGRKLARSFVHNP